MEATAKQTRIRMPARKIRRVINTIRGKSVNEAMNMLKFMPYFAARVVEKNIKCAAANALEQWGTSVEELVVSEVFADDGPVYKRAKPRAQGRIYRIQKRTSQLTVKVKVSEELIKRLEEKKQAKKAKKAAPKPVKEVKEVKQEPEQGITPDMQTSPEIESPVETETSKEEEK